MKLINCSRIVTAIFFLFFSASVFAFEEAPVGSVKGHVITKDGQPAAYISVTIEALHKGTMTDENGNYSLRSVQVGSWTVKASAVGIKAQAITVTITKGKTSIVDFAMDETSEQLQQVTVSTLSRQRSTSSALRISEPIIEAPQNIQVISSELLNNQILTNMADGVYKNVSGMTRIEHFADLYTRINTRGWRATALRNGMNITGDWGPLSEDMGIVDRIEFVKGPAGFLMSVGDPGGTYNVVTKKPTGKDFNGSANLVYGSYDFYRAGLDLDGKLNKSGSLLYRLNLVGQNKNSFRKYEYNDRYVVAPVITYKIDDKTSLTAEYLYQKAKMSDLGADYAFSLDGFGTLPRDFTTSDPGLDPTNINDQSLTLNFQRQLNVDWKFTAQTGYFYFRQKGANLWPASINENGDLLRQVGIWDAKSINKYGQAYFNGDVQTGQVHHRVLIGLDLTDKEYMADWNQYHDLDDGDHLFDVHSTDYQPPVNGYASFDYTTPLEQRSIGSVYNESYTGLYVQDELGFFNNTLRLTLAGRYTHAAINNYGDFLTKNRFTPRIGLGYSFTDDFSAYALFDQSFMPQSGQLRTGAGVPPILASDVEFGLKKNWAGDKFVTSVSVYRTSRDHVTASDPTDPTGMYMVAIGKTLSQGVEFDAKGELLPGLSAVVNYAYTDSKVTKTSEGAGLSVGDKVPGFAKHNINTWLTYKVKNGVLKGLGFSGGFSYQADRTSWTWTSDADTQSLPDYFRLDGGINYDLGNLGFTLNVYNILDKYLYSGDVGFWEVGGVDKNVYSWQSEPPRNFKFSINYRF